MLTRRLNNKLKENVLLLKVRFVLNRVFLSSIAIGLLVAPLSVQADNSLNLQGTMGLLNVPSANVVAYGSGAVSYTDGMMLNQASVHNNNLHGVFGVFPHVEVGGRIAWFSTHTNLFEKSDVGPRDLSANMKLNIPYIPKNWFSLAVGRQDFGGQASFFDTTYAVASKTIGLGFLGEFTADLGVGKSNSSERLNGVFGGGEYQPLPWIGFLGEYDGVNANAGLRLKTPDNWLPNGMEAALTSQLFTSADKGGKNFFGVSLNFPLSGRAQAASLSKPDVIAKALPPLPKVSTPSKPLHSAKASSLKGKHLVRDELPLALYQSLADLLKDKGFEHIQVGVQKGVLVIALENNVYNQNELDAVGVVLSKAQQEAGSHFSRISLYLKNQGIALFNVQVDAKDYGQFLKGEGRAVSIKARYAHFKELKQVDWKAEAELGWYVKPRLTLSPSISYGVATEFGVFDYSLALKNNVSLNLWPGAMLSASVLVPVSNSEDFQEGGPFYASRQKSGLKEVSAQQTIPLGSNVLTQFQFGRFRVDYNGGLNETLIFSPSGHHALTTKLGRFAHRVNNNDSHNVRLARYRYFWGRYDAALSATVGEFWGGDSGFRLDADFYFDDNAVSLFYKDTDAKFVGIKWTLPLTFRRDFNGRYGQVKGSERWGTSLQTRIRETANVVSFGVGNDPSFEWDLDRTYFNNDRLSPAYLYRHLDRLKEAANL